MRKVRNIVGVLAGVMLVASCFAHSILGWDEISRQLSRTRASQELVDGFRMGWMYGGMAMAVMGATVLLIFAKRLRGREACSDPAKAIAAGYLAFAVWAAVTTNFDPFFWMFLTPGALLAFAAWD